MLEVGHHDIIRITILESQYDTILRYPNYDIYICDTLQRSRKLKALIVDMFYNVIQVL